MSFYWELADNKIFKETKHGRGGHSQAETQERQELNDSASPYTGPVRFEVMNIKSPRLLLVEIKNAELSHFSSLISKPLSYSARQSGSEDPNRGLQVGQLKLGMTCLTKLELHSS